MSDVYFATQRVPEGPQAVIEPLRAPTPDYTKVGEAIAQVGQAGSLYAQRMQHAREETNEAQRKTETFVKLNELEKAGTEPGADFRTAPQKFNEASKKYLEDTAATIQDPMRKAQFQLWATQHILTSRNQVERTALINETNFNQAAFATREQEYQRRVLVAGSPVERESVVAEWSKDIEAQEKAQWMTPQQAVQKRSRQGQLVTEAVQGQMNDGLQAMRNRIGTAGDAPGVHVETAKALGEGEAYIKSFNLPPLTQDALLRSWQQTVAETGLHRLGTVDPAAAREAGGKPQAGNFVDRTIAVEGTGKNPNSSAFGVGQFINSTWLSMVRKYRPELLTGRTTDEVLALRRDPVLGREMTARYAEENGQYLKGRGLETTNRNLYLAHFLGPQGAVNVLSVDPSTPVERVLGEDQIAANASVLRGKTVGQVLAWAEGLQSGAKGGGGGQAFTGGNPLYSAVPYEKRVAILDAATASASQAASALEAAQKQATKELSENIVKEAYKRNEDGTLTAEFVEQVRPHASKAEYENLLKMLRPDQEKIQDDPEAVIDLQRRIDAETPAEFQKQAAQYVRDGKLKTTTFTTMSDRNRVAQRDDAPASPYRSGRELVKRSLDPGLMVSGPARAPLAVAEAAGLQAYDDWAAANPNATREQVMEQAADIVRRHIAVQLPAMRLNTALSPYFGTTNKNNVTKETVDQAEDSLWRDMQTGRLTPQQVAKETANLNQWREIIDREEANKAPAPRARP